MRPPSQSARAALAALAILQMVMLLSMATRTAPHPPLSITLFAMGPFLGFALALIAAAWLLGGDGSTPGRLFSTLAAAAALISYGPQKWTDPAIGEIWPAVLGGEIAAITLLICAILGPRSAN